MRSRIPLRKGLAVLLCACILPWPPAWAQAPPAVKDKPGLGFFNEADSDCPETLTPEDCPPLDDRDEDFRPGSSASGTDNSPKPILADAGGQTLMRLAGQIP